MTEEMNTMLQELEPIRKKAEEEDAVTKVVNLIQQEMEAIASHDDELAERIELSMTAYPIDVIKKAAAIHEELEKQVEEIMRR